MIKKKSPHELEIMTEGGRLLAQIKGQLVDFAQAGVSGLEIDHLATKLIVEAGAQVSFAMEPGYRWATCIDINDGVVHGVPTAYRLRPGDVVNLDVGLSWLGFHSDTSVTVGVGKISHQNERFLAAGRQTLEQALSVVKVGRQIIDISRTIEKGIRKYGYSPVAALSGHGIGRRLHEDPLIPCVAIGDRRQSPTIEPGMALAIEVIYTQGNGEVAYGGSLLPSGERSTTRDDGWTIVSLDGTIGAVFEETITVTEAGPRVVTRLGPESPRHFS